MVPWCRCEVRGEILADISHTTALPPSHHPMPVVLGKPKPLKKVQRKVGEVPRCRAATQTKSKLQ